jgi:hypothetical protein
MRVRGQGCHILRSTKSAISIVLSILVAAEPYGARLQTTSVQHQASNPNRSGPLPRTPAAKQRTSLPAIPDAISLTSVGGKLWTLRRGGNVAVLQGGGTGQRWHPVDTVRGAVAMSSSGATLLVGTQEGKIMARTAVERGSWRTIGTVRGIVAMAAANRTLYVATRDGKLLALTLGTAGKQSWINVGNASGIVAMAADKRNLYAVDRNRRLLTRPLRSNSSKWNELNTRMYKGGLTIVGSSIISLGPNGEIVRTPTVSSPTAVATRRLVESRTLRGVLPPHPPHEATDLQYLFRPPANYRPGLARTSGLASSGPTWGGHRDSQVADAISGFRGSFKDLIELLQRLRQEGNPERLNLGRLNVRPFERACAARTEAQPAANPASQLPRKEIVFDGSVTLAAQMQGYTLDAPPQGFSGFIIVADEIVIRQNIHTSGHDLILIAERIRVPQAVNQVTIDTTPPAPSEPPLDSPGENGKNGGNVMIVVRDESDLTRLRVITSGANGQNGGDGHMASVPPLSTPITLAAQPTPRYAMVTMLYGLRDNNSDDARRSMFRITGQQGPTSCPPRKPAQTAFAPGTVGITGQITPTWADPPVYPNAGTTYTMDFPWGDADCSRVGNSNVRCYSHNIAPSYPLEYVLDYRIPKDSYPAPGQPGGYGGYPGKATLMYGYTASTPPDFNLEAKTGKDGVPGKGGPSNDITAAQIQQGGHLVQASDLLKTYTEMVPRAVYNIARDPNNAARTVNPLYNIHAEDPQAQNTNARNTQVTLPSSSVIGFDVASGMASRFAARPNGTGQITFSVRRPYPLSVMYWCDGPYGGYGTEPQLDAHTYGKGLDLYEFVRPEGFVLRSPGNPDTMKLTVYRKHGFPGDLYLSTLSLTERALGSFPTGYSGFASAGAVFKNSAPDRVSLDSYWNATTGDYLTVSSAEGKQWANNNGYQHVRTEGYIYADHRSGTTPLRQYVNKLRNDTYTTVDRPGASPESARLYHNTLNLWPANGDDALPLCFAPTITEQPNVIQSNWYETTYSLVPTYPDRLMRKADDLYRAGNFALAEPVYLKVMAFLGQSGYAPPLSKAIVEERLSNGRAGLDYFGLTPSGFSVGSPTTQADLLDAYANHVQWFNTAIGQQLQQIATTAAARTIFSEFQNQHESLITALSADQADLYDQLSAASIDIEGASFEVGETIRSIQRQGDLLASWARYVDVKLSELPRSQPAPCDICTTLLQIWNVVKLVASIIAMVYGYYQAFVSFSESAEALYELESDYGNQEHYGGTVDVIVFDDPSENQVHLIHDVQAIEQSDASSAKFFNSLDKLATSLNKAAATTQDVATKLQQLGSSISAQAANSTTAQQFQQNVLLADEIGISGGLTYLQIQENIEREQNMLYSRLTAIKSMEIKRKAILRRILATKVELTRQMQHRQELQDTLAGFDAQQIALQDVKNSLTAMGQGFVDVLLSRLHQASLQLNFLQLTDGAVNTRYDRHSDNSVEIGAALQDHIAFKAAIAKWKADNGHLGLLKVELAPSATATGALFLPTTSTLDRFRQGKLSREPLLMHIEPLRESRFVSNVAAQLIAAQGDSAAIVAVLDGAFVRNDQGTLSLRGVDDLGNSEVQNTVTREREFAPILQSAMAAQLSDIDVVILYSLVKARISLSLLDSIIAQPSLSAALKRELQPIRAIYSDFKPAIEAEPLISLRAVSEQLKMNANDRAAQVSVLTSAFQQEPDLRKFRLRDADVLQEINTYSDPAPPQLSVFEFSRSNTWSVCLAEALLFGGVDAPAISEMLQRVPAGSQLSNSLSQLASHWSDLQRVVMETSHSLRFDVSSAQLYGVPGISGTYAHRVLTARVSITTPTGDLPWGVRLRKVPKDRWAVKDVTGTKEIAWDTPLAEMLAFGADIVLPATLTFEDYHLGSLFARSVMGTWELEFNYPGNLPALPTFQSVRVEILYSYRQ